MNKKKIINGILYSASASLFWGVLGVFYFKSVAFAGPIELVVHRTIWTAFILFFTTYYYSKWDEFFSIFKSVKKISMLFLSGLLILTNWATWIYAVVDNKLVDASFGYYIFPILSVFFGFIFFKEPYNKKKIFSVVLVAISVIYLVINFESTPWIGLIVAFSWALYNLVRKKVKVSADTGLFIESLFMTPFALIAFYILVLEGNNYFSLNDLKVSVLLFFAGIMTLIPLFLYLKGAALAGLGTSGMIFFLTPTGQFLLGVFYFNEDLDIHKLISFVVIWIAVIIYLKDLRDEHFKTKKQKVH